ncbi:MAG TPA: hypothetical protein VKY74_25155 [Chloroflexia bacterium]|nr:hypothetical protein [Chloroflexia bacterium]
MAGNERLTALAGAVLLVLIVAEVATVPRIRGLISLHIFVGVMLAGPLAVKTASTGWRFIRYYTRNPAYRHKGPPSPFLRVLAPLLLIATLVEIGSGIALVSTRPGSVGALLAVHHAGFLVFTVLVIIHGLAYIRRVPGLIASDWRHDREQQAPGRTQRVAVNLAALLLGALAALLVLPAFDAWIHW